MRTPGFRGSAGGLCAGHGGGDEQGTRSWPAGNRSAPRDSHSQAWPATMPYGMPTPWARVLEQRASTLGDFAARRQRLEGQHDQRVAGQHGQRLAIGPVHRGAAAAHGASSKQGRSSCTSDAQCSSSMATAAASESVGVIVATGHWPRPGTAWGGCVHRQGTPHGGWRRQLGWAAGCLAGRNCLCEGLFNAGDGFQADSPW
jgi:hypothetical protein